MRVHISRIAALAPVPRTIDFVVDFTMLLRGVKNPRAAGRMMETCWSLPNVVCYVFSGMDFRRSSP